MQTRDAVQQPGECVRFGEVALHHGAVRQVGTGRVAGERPDLMAALQELTHEVAADGTGGTGYENRHGPTVAGEAVRF